MNSRSDIGHDDSTINIVVVIIIMMIVAVAPGSTMLNASASGRDADFPGSRGSGVSGT